MDTGILLSALLALQGAAGPWASLGERAAVPRGFDVILSIGQSNAYFGFGEDPALDAPNPRIFQYGRYGAHDRRAVRAREPLEHWNHPDGYVGHALTFAKLVLPELPAERSILIVPCAKGATAVLDFWSPGEVAVPGDGGEGYEDAVLRTQEVLANPDNRLFAILWQQGEADLVPVPNPDYQAQLDEMIKALRLELDASDVPFLLGGLVPYWVERDPTVREPHAEIIADTPNRMAHTAYVDPAGLNAHRPGDGRHFSASAQRGIAPDQERGLAGRYVAQLANARENALVPGLPDAPYSLRASSRQGGRTTLTWIAPWERSASLTGYEVELRKTGEVSWFPAAVTVLGEDVAAVVPGLDDGVEYELRVRALNSVGAGPFASVGGVRPAAFTPDVDLLLHAGFEAGYVDYTPPMVRIDPFGNSALVVDPERGLVHRSSADSFVMTSIALRPGDSYTAAAWVRLDAPVAPVGWVFAPETVGVANPFLRVDVAGGLGQLVAGHGASVVAGPADLAPGGWHHACVTYDDATGLAALYVDGVLAASGSLPPIEATANVVAGNSGELADEGFIGRLDDLRLFDRALDGDEVAALFELERTR